MAGRYSIILSLLLFASYLNAGNIPIAICSPNFSSAYTSNWTLNGTSTVVSNALQLTDDLGDQAGSAFWTGTVCNSNSFKFSAFFQFRMTHTGSSVPYADGMTFIIQQYANNWGASGGGLGYQGLPGKSIAIEFDTYQNSAEYNDPDANHIAIDFGGSVLHSSTSTYAKSSKLGLTLGSNQALYAWVDYTGTTLEVRISKTITRPSSPVLSYPCDLAGYFDGANVYYGFAGATGWGMERNTVNSVYINNDYTPIDLAHNTYSQKSPSASTTYKTICQGGSYTFNGTTYTQAGTYSITLPNYVGCDSVATLVLKVNQPSSSSTNQSICQGGSYTFNGTTYTQAGTYSITLPNYVGCDSVATLVLKVNQPSSSTTNQSICQGGSYTFNGNTYTTAGTYTAHLTNAVGCDSVATLVLKVNQPSSSSTPVSICQGDSYTFNGITHTTAGTYTAHLTNSVGCDSVATLVLKVNQPSSSTTNQSICQGGSYTFNGATYTTAGTYTAHLTNAVGCDSVATLVLKVNQPSSSSTNQSICQGGSYTFNGITYTTAGTYTAHLTNAVGCDSVATLVLKVNQPSSSSTQVSICQGGSYTFNGITYTTAGAYTAHLTNAVGCDSVATLVLKVNQPSSSSTNQSICQGGSYTFNGITYTTAGTYTAHLTNAVGCDSVATLVLKVNQPSSSSTQVSICQGGSYTFNGITYTTAGTYTAHLTNAVGCDSVATLVLKVNQPSSSTTNQSICQGGSYTFNGITYTTAGTYTAHLTNSVGCDSVATLVLKVNQPSSSTTNESICQGDSYTFNGATYTIAGTYTAHLTNSVGCDSVATLVLKVNQPSSSSTPVSICQGDSYTFNGTTYTAAGTYTAHLTNSVGCDSVATLVLKVNQPSSSSTNQSICPGDSYTFNGATYTTVGTYTAHLLNSVGCDSVATLVLKVNQPSSSSTPVSICQGDSYTFNGITHTTAGTYTAHLLNSVGCDSVATLVLKVNQPSSSSTPVSICQGDSYTFNGITHTTAGTYTAHLTNAVGCDSVATLVLKVNQPSSSSTPVSICQGDSYTFNGATYTIAGTYTAHLLNSVGCDSVATLVLKVNQPSSSSTPVSICQGGSYTFNGITHITAGTYTAHLTNAVGCDSVATLVLKVNQPSSSSTNQSICPGDSYTFNGATYTIAGTYTAHLLNSVGCDSVATLVLKVNQPSSSSTPVSICQGGSYTFNGTTYTAAGTYTAHLTNSVGCDSVATLVLKVNQPSSSSTQVSICQGDSYTFNGTTYTAAGTYTAHFTNSVGCDSVATLVLKVNQPSSSSTNQSICQGDSYTFNGTTYTAAGTYTAHFTNSVGCDSVATLVLKVNQPSSSSTPVSICQGDSYTFNGTTYTAAGTYTAHFTNSVGCDSVATLVLKVNQPSSSSTPVSICQGGSYTFNGTTYTTAGTYTAHLTNSVGCDSVATLVLKVNQPSSSSTPVSICQGDSYTFNGITHTTAGTYTAHLTNSVGCDSVATLVLKVNQPSSSSTNQSICQGDSYTFNGATYTTAGTYTAHLTNSVGCDSVATLVLKVNQPSSSSTNQSICPGDSYTFNGATYTTAGTYTAHLLNSVGCDSVATLVLKVNQPSSSSTNQSICQGGSYTFNGTTYTAAGTYTAHLLNSVGCDSVATLVLKVNQPSSSSTPVSICQGDSYTFNGITHTTAGTYTAHLLNSVGCDSVATLVLKVNQPSSSSTNQSICPGDSYTFNGATYTTAGTYTAHLLNSVGCDSVATLVLKVNQPSSSSTPVSICQGGSYTFNGITHTTAGTYTAHLTNAVGCDSVATLVLKVNQPSSSSTNQSICQGDSYTFNGATYTTAGAYTAHLTNSVGCDSVATLVLKVNQPSSSSTPVSICQGDSYTFNGTTYTAAGTYTAHFTNSVGCDSVATLVLKVNQPSSSSTNQSICLGDSYTFNGTTYTTAGTYTAHLTNSVGCDSVATLVLKVKEITSSVTRASICKGESYVFNGVAYVKSGTYTSHFTNAVGCDSSAVLELNVKEPSSSITRATVCLGDHYTFNGNVYTTVGTYAVHLVNAVGCDSTAILELTICYAQTVQLKDTILQNQNYSGYGFAIPTQPKYGEWTFYQHKKTVHGCDSIVVLNLLVSPDFNVEVKPVPEICGDDKYFTLTYEIKSGVIETDSVAFSGQALKAGFKNTKKQNAIGSIDIPLPSRVVPDSYTLDIVFRNGYIEKKIPVTIAIDYPSSVILQKWNDVLALLNSTYNGGYEFSAYQWYKNDQPLEGENHSYLYIKNGTLDTNAQYKARVTRVSDGVVRFTCPVVPVVKSDVSVFPTELLATRNVTIRTTASGKATLMKMSGVVLKEQVIQSGDNIMTVSLPAGNYVLVVVSEQGDVKQQILVVK